MTTELRKSYLFFSPEQSLRGIMAVIFIFLFLRLYDIVLCYMFDYLLFDFTSCYIVIYYSLIILECISGAFLIPYAISLICIGIPIFFLELSIGQRLRKGPLGVWSTISPYFTGLGLSSVVVSFLVGIYYNMIVAWCLYYFFISFAKTPPFVECPRKNGVIVEECRKAGATSFYW